MGKIKCGRERFYKKLYQFRTGGYYQPYLGVHYQMQEQIFWKTPIPFNVSATKTNTEITHALCETSDIEIIKEISYYSTKKQLRTYKRILTESQQQTTDDIRIFYETDHASYLIM